MGALGSGPGHRQPVFLAWQAHSNPIEPQGLAPLPKVPPPAPFSPVPRRGCLGSDPQCISRQQSAGQASGVAAAQQGRGQQEESPPCRWCPGHPRWPELTFCCPLSLAWGALGCPRAARPAWLDRGAGCSGRLRASGLMKCGETPPDTSAGVKGAGGRPGRLPGVLSGPGVSDARLVAVEGRDVEHVAVRAHPHGLHLPVAGQRGRVRGAARAEDLEGAAGQSGR